MIKNAVKKLFIVSGPSGAGKDTVINALLKNAPIYVFRYPA